MQQIRGVVYGLLCAQVYISAGELIRSTLGEQWVHEAIIDHLSPMLSLGMYGDALEAIIVEMGHSLSLSVQQQTVQALTEDAEATCTAEQHQEVVVPEWHVSDTPAHTKGMQSDTEQADLPPSMHAQHAPAEVSDPHEAEQHKEVVVHEWLVSDSPPFLAHEKLISSVTERIEAVVADELHVISCAAAVSDAPPFIHVQHTVADALDPHDALLERHKSVLLVEKAHASGLARAVELTTRTSTQHRADLHGARGSAWWLLLPVSAFVVLFTLSSWSERNAQQQRALVACHLRKMQHDLKVLPHGQCSTIYNL